MKDVANAISNKYPEVHLMVVLIGERPEEVTDMDRSVEAEGHRQHHSMIWRPVMCAWRKMALARAKRLVESQARCGHPAG